MFNSFFYYNKRERKAMLGLIVMLVLAVICNIIFNIRDNRHMVESVAADSLFLVCCDSFRIVTLSQKANVYHSDVRTHKFNLRDFDPNKSDSLTLTDIGLKPWIVSNILKYRRKGGVFRSADDFSKVYGMDSSSFYLLKPFVNIDLGNDAIKSDSITGDSVLKAGSWKFQSVVRLDLNVCDTADLKRIPGIGEGYANIIVNYRKDLGGFVDVGQIGDVVPVNDSVMSVWRKYLYVDSVKISTININTASISRLKHHPYLNFYQAKVIVELRSELGRIGSFEQLKLFEEFENTDWEKLKPYFLFE